jgi:hypothetical protein
MPNLYKVPVYYQVVEYINVEAESAESAIQQLKDTEDSIHTHCGDAHYIDESFEIESDPGQVIRVK